MAAALGGMGVLHLAKPEPFDQLIPPMLPGSARAWTYGSGVAELAVAGLLAVPATRRAGGAAAAALFDRAVNSGATAVTRTETAHGWLLGRLLDPFGHHWEIGKQVE